MRTGILIAEDSPTQATLLEETLRVRGYQTQTVANGRLALEAARRRRPDLIISDIRMPVMDGIQLCREVKLDPGLHGIPVILLTTLSTPADLLSAYTVFEAANGKSALDMFPFLAKKPDLVLTDIVMPELNGTEMAERLRRLHPSLPVIFMSGYVDQRAQDASRLLPLSVLLQKPVQQEMLLAAIRKALDEKGKGAEFRINLPRADGAPRQ